MTTSKLVVSIRLIAIAVLVGALTSSAHAYIDLAPTLAKVITDSRKIVLVEVVEFSRDKHEVVLKEIRTLKGDPVSSELIHHDVASAEGATIPRQVVQWAAPGAHAVMFGSRATSLVCVGQGWYQVRSTGDGWKLGAERPDLPLAYYGTLSRLSSSVEQMLAGKDAVLTVVAFGADDEGASFDLALNRPAIPGLVRLQRIRANLRMPATVMGSSSSPAYFLGGGTVDESELPALTEKLKSSDAMVRAEAAEDLRSLGRKAAAASEPLKGLLSDPSPRVRVWAAAALLRIQTSNKSAVDVIGKELSSSDVGVRREAARAAGLAGAGAAPLTDKLAALLKDSDESTRITALQAISTLGKTASSAAPPVAALLDEPAMAIDAADALGRIGVAARPALPKLAKMLTSEDPAVRWAAVRGMSQIGGPDAKPAVDFMIAALPRATEVEGYNMMIYLSLLGPVAADAMPTVWNTPIKNPVLPSALQWAMAPEQSFPWQGGGRGGRGGPGGRGGRGGGPGGPGGRGPGGGGGGGDIFSLIYQSYVRELGDRLRPAAKVLAQQIMNGTAGEIPSWGYEILACGPEESIAILTPYLGNEDINTRERATVALGFMGPAAAPAREQLTAAMNKAPTEREKRLIQWSLHEIEAN